MNTARRARISDIVLGGLTAGALTTDLLLIAGLLGLLAYNGLGYFATRPLVELELRTGDVLLGEIREQEIVSSGPARGRERLRMHIANRDLSGLEFRWVELSDVSARSEPADAVLLERREWGRFYGFVEALVRGEQVLASGKEATGAELQALLAQKSALRARIQGLQQALAQEIGRRSSSQDPAAAREREGEIENQLASLRENLATEALKVRTADGTRASIPIAEIVRVVHPNGQGVLDAAALYIARVFEFVSDEPRESNTDGGIFPAIFGTVLMVLLTSIAVAPLGILTAIYLREYAGGGWPVRAVRVAIHSLAGVPSIVFGVFGLGFFVYLVGGSLDQWFFSDALPAPTLGTGGILWASLTLALLTVPVVVVATEEGLTAVPHSFREGSLALGATRFETLRRVVLPAASPGMLTGLILAMARAAGEVAPLMIVGTVKLAPSLPLDGEFPFLHLDRKFMHLGFHIYDLGFQSPHVEAAQPLVFATALLLIAVVLLTNLTAILLRNRLRRNNTTSAV